MNLQSTKKIDRQCVGLPTSCVTLCVLGRVSTYKKGVAAQNGKEKRGKAMSKEEVVCCDTCANDTIENHCSNRDNGPCKDCYYKNWRPKEREKHENSR